jgi:oligopeptide transport system permease protein
MTETRRADNTAWQRWWKHHFAVVSAGLLVIIVGAVILAPWVGANDPESQRPWLGALPPGSEALVVGGHNNWTEGQIVDAPARLHQPGTYQITTQEQTVERWRIVLSRGRVRTIFHENSAENLSSWTAPDATQRIDAEGAGTPLPAGSITVGQPAPEGWFPGRERVLLAQANGPVTTVTYQITVGAAGVVENIYSAGESEKTLPSLTMNGRGITDLTHNGTAVTEWFPLGTDASGRDVWSRLLHGGRISLLVGLVATVVSVFIGVGYGAVAGLAGGRVERLMMQGVDILYGIPFLFLVILLIVNFGNNILLLFIALGAVQWLTMARMIRSQVATLRERDFFAAARLAGAPLSAIVWRHVLPNTLGIVAVYATLNIPLIILEESFLAFIGLQVEMGDEKVDSWGSLVHYGINHHQFPWLLWIPSLTMAVTLLALNAVGDGLRDALDPRDRESLL